MQLCEQSTGLSPPPNPPATAPRGGKRATLRRLLQNIEHRKERNIPATELKSDPLLPLIETIATAGDNRKATHVNAIRVEEWTDTTSFIVIIEGNNRLQTQAIALAIEEDMEEQHEKKPQSKEIDPTGGWLLLDYGSIIVHIMTPQMRNYYKLERKWKDGEVVDLSHILLANQAKTQRASLEDDADLDEQNYKDEEDPFWT
eukprot:gene7659-8464_t